MYILLRTYCLEILWWAYVGHTWGIHAQRRPSVELTQPTARASRTSRMSGGNLGVTGWVKTPITQLYPSVLICNSLKANAGAFGTWIAL